MAGKVKRSIWVTLTVIACTFAMVAPASAVQVFWTLQGFSFRLPDGGYADGSFVYDAATGEISWWDISVSSGTPPYTAFRYQSGLPEHTANLTNTGTVRFWFRNPSIPGGRQLFLFHAALALTDAGGVVVMPGGESGELVSPDTGGSHVRFFGEPEPLRGKLLSTVTPVDFAAGCRVGPVLQSGDPVNLETGAYTYSALLLEGASSSQPFKFEIFYDSSAIPGDGIVGRKWTHSYEWRLQEYSTNAFGIPYGYAIPTSTSTRLKVVRGDGAADYFDFRLVGAAHAWVPTFPQTRARLEPNGDGTFTYTDPERSRYSFDSLGRLAAISDRNGQTANLSYGGNGRLASFVGPPPASRVATFAYNANNRIQSINYGFGLMRVAFTYDGAGNLASFSSPTNPAFTTRFTYDGDGNLLTGTTGTGPADDVRFVHNTYASGLVVAQLDANDRETTFAYGPTGATVTDPGGRVSTRTIDEQGRIIGAANEAGANFSWSYDQRGNLTRVQGPRGSRTMSLDPVTGNLMGMTLEDGSSIGLIWDANSRLTGVVDGNGNLRSYTYDASGNVTGFTNPVNHGTSFQHDGNGRLTRQTDATGIVTTLHYDAMGELDTVTTATGNVAFTYDSFGNANSVTDQNGRTTGLSYDAAGAVSSVTDAVGQKWDFVNDAFGRLLKEETPDGRSVAYERDRMGQITATVDGMGNRFDYGYDATGRMVSKTDPLGAQTRYAYHANGQLDMTTDAMGRTASATFNAAGKKATVTDPNGNAIGFEYDSLGRVKVEIDPLSRRTQTFYDSGGSVSQVTNARSQSITYEYDDAGSLITTRLPGDTVSYTLNPEGKRTAATHAAGTTSVVYDDALGRIRTRTDELGNVIRYAYDAIGNLTALTYSDGKTVTYTYDPTNRMKTVQDWRGRTTTYTYDTGGSLVRTDLPDGSSVSYALDAGGHLTEMIDRTGTGSTIYSGRYAYDAAGRTRSADVTLPLQPVLSEETSLISYDAAHQIKAVDGVPFSFDADGNLTNGRVEGVSTTLVYDSLNRLVQRNSDLYRYDTDNLRIAIVRGSVTTRYVWDGSSRQLRLLEEQDSNGVIVARYVHGVGLIGREDAATGALAVYHFDQRGSTVALTSPTGVITDRYAYDAYGKVVGRQGGTPNPFTYSGRDGVFDDGTGLYYMTSRYYIPSLGRFAQKESIFRGSLFRPGSMNRYAYAEGNPIDRIDPRGEWWGAAFAAIGAVTSAATQVVSNAVANRPWYEGVAGAALEGAINGAAISLGPWGQAAAGAAAAGLGGALNQGIDLASGNRSSFDLGLVATDMAVGGVSGGIVGKLMPAPASPIGPYLKVLPPKPPNLVSGARAVITGTSEAGEKAAKAYVIQNIKAAQSRFGNTVNLLIGGPGKGLTSHQFGSTGVSGVIAGIIGRTTENCGLKPRDTLEGKLGLGQSISVGGQYLINEVSGMIRN